VDNLHKSKEAAPFQKISLTQIFRFYNNKNAGLLIILHFY